MYIYCGNIPDLKMISGRTTGFSSRFRSDWYEFHNEVNFHTFLVLHKKKDGLNESKLTVIHK